MVMALLVEATKLVPATKLVSLVMFGFMKQKRCKEQNWKKVTARDI